MANFLGKLRRWIDGDINAVEEKALLEIHKKSAKSRTLVNKIIAEILNFLQDEIIQFSNERIYIPSHFAVHLNPTDDKEMRRDKRDVLEEALSDLILEEIKRISGKGEISAKKLSFSLKVDENLKDNEILVKVIPNDTDKTEKISIQKKELKEALPDIEKIFRAELDKGINAITLKLNELNKYLVCSNCKNANPIGNYYCLECGWKIVNDSTVPDSKSSLNSESGLILYQVDVLEDDKFIERVSVIQSEILVGRDSSKCKANIKLSSPNLHISSSHLYLILNEKGELLAKPLTDNQTLVNGRPTIKDEEVIIHKDSEINIYEFTLRFVF
jgi:hypothetical protein